MYDSLRKEIRDSIVFTKSPPLSDPRSNYQGFNPGKNILKKGYKKTDDALALPCDIIQERDVSITLRDGVTIYVDIYRPSVDLKVPAIVASTIFGKNGSYVTLDMIPGMAGIAPGTLSGLQTWEGPDPAFWCDNGYAVVNVDMRGIGMSEGDACYFGSQDSDDNYDIIEWLAVREWCIGKAAMAGNSWLAITQWYAAARNPPHLTAIAPWEGHANMYEDEYMRGGIPVFSAARINLSYGNNSMEDLPAMMRKYPLMNEYWEDKIAAFEKITLPSYVVASYTSSLHTHGTIEGFRKISSSEKWLRIHNSQEWPDFYDPKYSAELLKFFDYFLKGINNGWEKTSRVRMSILDPGGLDEIDRMEQDFPLERQEFKRLYLNAENLSTDWNPVINPSSASYVADDDEGKLCFKVQFDKETEITGYMKLKLWVEADGSDDMDVFVRIVKLSEKEEILYHDAVLYKYSGPNGMLRVSHRRIDEKLSTNSEPYHPHKIIEKLRPGQIVPIEIGIWPTSLLFHAGQKLQVVIAGFDYVGLIGHWGEPINFNKGRHIIHTGGAYDSHLLMPIIPAACEVL